MKISQPLLRGAAIVAVGLAIFSTTAVIQTPTAEASAMEKKNGKAAKVDNDNDSGGGLSNVPIIGDLVGSFEGQEPEDIAVSAIQITAGVAETVVPMVIRAFK